MGLKIVLTGGPASAKTEFFNRLKKHPAFADFVFFEELARQLLQQSPALRHDPAEFHRRIYRLQTAREAAAGDKSFITDRGTVDAFAFHPQTLDDVGSNLDREYRRYDAVIQLGSAALLGEPYYQQDPVRRESPEEAMVIEQALCNVWKNHPNYDFIAAQQDLEGKFRTFCARLEKIIKQHKQVDK